MSVGRKITRNALVAQRKAYRKAVGRCPLRADRGAHLVTKKRCGDGHEHIVCRSCGKEWGDPHSLAAG